jgi:flagellin
MASFSVVSNVSAVNAQANLATTNIGLQKALERMSSGYRINRSGDDAAGLVVAQRLSLDVAVLTQGVRNAGDGLSTLQIEDGALNNIATLLDRMSTLATQSASASSTVDRTVLDAEFQDVIAEIDREASVAGPRPRPGVLGVRQQRRRERRIIAASIGAADATDARRRRAAVDTAANAATAGRPSRRRSARSVRRRRPSARCRTVCSSRSTLAQARSSTPRPPRAGSATRTSRKSRRT